MLVIIRRAVEEADEFVEPMVDWVVLVLISTVPLAEKSSRVTMVLEDRGRVGIDGDMPL